MYYFNNVQILNFIKMKFLDITFDKRQIWSSYTRINIYYIYLTIEKCFFYNNMIIFKTILIYKFIQMIKLLQCCLCC